MIAVDSNILVYAHLLQSPWNEQAYLLMQRLWSDSEPWLIPWPCLHEFYAVVTNRNAYKPPTSPDAAAEQIDTWLSSPSVIIASEGAEHWPTLSEMINGADITGSKIHDAKIAAICLQSGVTKLYTADRDYSRFPALNCENPLVRRK